MRNEEKIILASGSPRRRELLTLIGIPYEVIVSSARETITKTHPGEIVEELSAQKAADVASQVTEGIILGADTIVWQDGKALGKPHDREQARTMLRALQGRAHEVYTGVTLIKKEKGEDGKETCQTVQFHSMTTVHVHSMSDAEIERYMDTGDPFDKAGSYGIQGPFAAFVDGIEGDYHTVMGLPVAKVYQELKKLRQQAG